MALVNKAYSEGNTFGYPEGYPYLETICTQPVLVTATAAALTVRYAFGGNGASGGFMVKNLGIKAVKSDVVMAVSEGTPVVATAYLDDGTATDSGNVTLTAGMTIEHEDPPCYDDGFTPFYVAAGETLILEHTTAATDGGSSGSYSIVCQIQHDPTGIHALD